MKALHLDLARPSRARIASRLSWAGWFGLVALAAALLSAIWRWQTQEAAWQPVRAERQMLETRLAKRVPVRSARADGTVTAEHRKAAVDMVRGLNIPWSDLVDTLEREAGRSVAILELNPQVGKGELALAGEAASATEMLRFVERLRQERRFANVVLERHEVNEGDRNHPLRFTVRMNWPGAMP